MRTRPNEPRGMRWARRTMAVPVFMLVAALAGNAGALGSPAETSDIPEATTRDVTELTTASPLPAFESPISFDLSDEPSYWFDTGRKDLEPVLHTRSLAAAVGGAPTQVKFNIGEPLTSENHTVSSIIWPDGAEGYPFLQQGSQQGELVATVEKPGLYAFQCRVHPYMLGAVVVDDPATPGADLGEKLRWIDGTVMPSFSDEILRIVRSFFIVTEPANWQVYADQDTAWDPSYPAAPIMTYEEDGSPHLIPNLDRFYQEMFAEPLTLEAPVKPSEAGVGTAYVDTQWEHSAGKTKPGSITAYDMETWDMKSKWFAPSVNLNNPHNMWADKDGKFLYQTNWFSKELTTFDRETGAVVNHLDVGPSPSHVQTRPNTDSLIIPNNGGNRIVEVAPGGGSVMRSYLTQKPGEAPAFPHAHWISYDGQHVITPNSNESQATIFNLDVPSMVKPESGGFPVATSMTNDGKRAYVANLLDHTVTCLSVTEAACPAEGGGVEASNRIDLRQNYDKITGESTGPYGLSPIQLPISPDDQYMLVVGTFSANVLVIDMETHEIVKSLPCGPGCHGIQFGLKKGGGWFGLVSVKFANKFIVVDGDPDADGDPRDARVAGEMLTNAAPGIQMDDRPTGNFGQGGNGVLAYPIPYNGWVQNAPEQWKSKLTCKQQAPVNAALC